MSTGTFFSLQNALSFSTRGRSGKLYYFELNKPTPVNIPEDIAAFRSKSELFECDKFCNKIQKEQIIGAGTLSFTKLRIGTQNYGTVTTENIINDFKPQETIQDALNPKKPYELDPENSEEYKERLRQLEKGELTKAQKLAMGLLDETDDSVDLNEDEQNNINLSENSKPKKRKQKAAKTKDKFQCSKCGAKLKNQKEYDEHMQLHEEEDE